MAFCTLVSCSSNFTDDRDGQSYSVVDIAGQIWMAENLNYSGVEVASGSFCPEGDERNCSKYGRLYSWEAAKVACPAGWRLPTRENFEKLMATAGEKSGKALKASSGWFKKGNGDDALGFRALPAGFKSDKFDGIGGYAHLWSATADSQESAFAYYLYLDFSSSVARLSSFSAADGRSVRCVKRQ
ncbi:MULTISPECIES: fibrobacter succinogenes major paralogous domain-containing protein [unclassified Fibrobacter]|uniref:fibrobacter succinogenes major paralogous domain-containing protein n=1 Tax=unclassified Fibrobacter TaxID=2634177 RepID=UPI001E4A4214|nr:MULTISPECIES: fibrobacter succinogenes major paralogous domain-containing protein [unclassified Fibrobacter]